MKDWGEVVAFALSLPDVVTAPYYGTPCPRVNGKAFASPRPEPCSFHVAALHDKKIVPIGTDPARVRDVIRRAWWNRANKGQRTGYRLSA